MAYLNTIPQAGDYLAISQGQILENFAQLETQLSIDHDTLLVTGASGKHFKMTMPERIAPFPTTGVNEGVLYTKEGASETELYFRTESNGFTGQISNMINAYVAFTGLTGAIVKAYNVASVTRSGIGQYVVNFTVGTFTNVNYIPAGIMKTLAGNEGASINEEAAIARTTGTYPCIAATSGAAVFDPDTVYLTFVGGR